MWDEMVFMVSAAFIYISIFTTIATNTLLSFERAQNMLLDVKIKWQLTWQSNASCLKIKF